MGATSEPDDRFGATVEVVDWNPGVDSCLDLAIGIPGENGGRGRVVVVLSSRNGLNLSRRVVLAQGANGTADTAEPGDRFGASMVAVDGLAVGVPGEDVGAAVDAGIVTVFRSSPSTGNISTPAGPSARGREGYPTARNGATGSVGRSHTNAVRPPPRLSSAYRARTSPGSSTRA